MQQIASYQKTASGVLVFNEKGQIVLSNAFINQLFGYDRDELLSMNIQQIIPSNLAKRQRSTALGPSLLASQAKGETIKISGLKKEGVKLVLDVSLCHFKGGNEYFTVAFILESHDSILPVNSSDTEISPNILLVLDKSGAILLINEYGCHLLGGDPETLKGINWFDNFLPKDKQRQLRTVYQKVFKTHLIEDYESPVVTQNGGQLTIRWTTAVICDSTGKPVATLSTGMDTGQTIEHEISPDYVERIQKMNEHLQLSVKQQTHELGTTLAKVENINRDLQWQINKRKVIEEKLMKIQRMYDTMVHNFPDGVIGVLNKEMKYVLIDGKDLNQIDLPALGLTGLRPVENKDAVLADETLKKLKRAFNGESVSFEIETKGRIYNVIAVPLPDTQNAINEILCVLRNVTERKRMEDGLRKALEKEKELGELKSRFVTMASHEFRTPLTTILSSTFLLENYTGENYEKEKLVHTNRIKRAVNNLTMILNEFLSIEKFEEDKVKVTFTAVDIPSYIKNVVFEMELLKKDGQAIEYHHSGKKEVINLDSKLLWSIVTNLISNALKYSKESRKIKVKSEIFDNSLKLTVSDSGIGIPPEEHKYIFERFYRARNATNFEGTGLGLHIVQKYVHLMKGTIAFESKLNGGTDFIVILPGGTIKDIST